MSYLDVSDHAFRSVRAWLHKLYPDLLIFIERTGQTPQATRPNALLQMIDGPHMDDANTSAVADVRMTFQVYYAAASRKDAERFKMVLAGESLPPVGRIQLNLYDFPYPVVPRALPGPGVGALPPQVVLAALAHADAVGSSTLLSAQVMVNVPLGESMRVSLPGWPVGDVWQTSWSLFAGTPLRLVGTAPRGEEIVLSALPGTSTPPPTAKLPFHGLRVESVDTRSTETMETDGAWDVWVTLRTCAQAPRIP